MMATRTAATSNRWFYTCFAICAFLIVFAGFAHTYYLRFAFKTKGLALLLQVHGFLFTAWFVLLFVQARLVARHRVDMHRKFGLAGALLAPLCAFVAIGVSFNAGRRFVLAHPTSLTDFPAQPLAMDFGTSLMFLALVVIALHLRRRPEYHKRIMILASCSLLLPAIGRIPLFGTVLFDAVGFWGLVAITEVPPVTCILYDTIKYRRLHPAFGWGGAVLVASFPTFLLVGASDPWLKFATWFLSR
jgi:hypothetical protein